jgi:RNA polymerase sigma-70 factor (ECF subfamily)
MTDRTDDELLAKAREGDHVAFRGLVERHQSIVAGTVIGMLGAGDEADDVGQETFIRFHRALRDFRGDSSVATYLRRIAMNLCLNALKRRRVMAFRLISRDQTDAPLDEPTVDGYDAEAVERRDMVRAAVARLSAKYRPVVVLRLLDGLSTRETAEILKVPAGTVMSRLARAMVELERMLAPYAREVTDEHG